MNQNLAKILRNMAFYLEMQEVAFKPRAYEKAAYEIESLNEDIKEIYKNGGVKALEKIPEIGKGIAEKIKEFIDSGEIAEYERMKEKIPVNIEELSAVEGVGPKIIKSLYEHLKIKDLHSLKTAAEKGKLKKLSRFGEKLEAKILKSLEFKIKSEKRMLLSDADAVYNTLKKNLLKIPGIKKIAFCGSLRRRKETVGDLDILAIARNAKKVSEAFAKFDEVASVYAKGKTKTMVRLLSGIDADLRIVPEESFGAALQYFTGSKAHNIALRKIAVQKNLKLNEYGLFKTGKKEIQIAGKNEEEIYEKLGLSFIPPELREMEEEIEAAKLNALPKLIELKDIKGDLQIQTNWTDGANSIREMSEAGKELNYEYIAITDHTKSLAMARGSDEKKLLKQGGDIKEINRAQRGFKILTGAEVNIMKDGSLDIKDSALQKLDFAGAAIHSHFRLSREEQTLRLIKVMENPNIDIIFHPTGRIINKREPVDLDIEKLFKAAVKTGTMLEINAYPERLDLKDEHIRLAKKLGVKFMINTDAHSKNQMRFIEYGVSQARRAGLTKNNVINTLALNELIAILAKPKDKRF